MQEDREGYRRQAAVLDLIAAYMRPKTMERAQKFATRFNRALNEEGLGVFQSISVAGQEAFGLVVPADWIKDYVTLILSQSANAAIGAFLRRVHEEPALHKAFLGAARDHDSLQRVAAANGLDIATSEWKTYLDPWQVLVTLLEKLLKQGSITAAQFEEKAGYPISDLDKPDFSSDVYRALLAAALSASTWAMRLRNISNLSVPIACVVFPTTAVIIGGYEGEQFSFVQLGEMFRDTFTNALESIADTLENFHNSVSSVFSGALAGVRPGAR